MNQESLDRANAFLAAVSSRTQVGDVLDITPAEVGRELGLPDPLSTARAVRALIARRRLEASHGSYRLLDASPVSSDEREQIGRSPRTMRRGPRGAEGGRQASTYSDFGRAAVDRLVELGREVAELRATSRQAKEDAREAREARIQAEQRASQLSERIRELEHRAEMAESNLRTLLAQARGQGHRGTEGGVSDSEMEAILGVLKGDGNQAG